MKHLLSLIDFSDVSLNLLKQSLELAKREKSRLDFIYVLGQDEEVGEIRDKLQSTLAEMASNDIKGDIIFLQGPFQDEVVACVDRIKPDLFLTAAYGRSGPRQNFSGVYIYRIIRRLERPTLVINDTQPAEPYPFNKILIPAAPHEDYHDKVKDSLSLLAPGGRIDLFLIHKKRIELSRRIESNLKAAQEFLDKQQIENDLIEVESRDDKLSYGSENLLYALENKYQAVSILGRVSKQNKSFGSLDKENMLVNDFGIPILCS